MLSSSHKEPLEIVSRDDVSPYLFCIVLFLIFFKHETIDNDCVTFELNSKKRNSRELLTEEQKRVNHIASEKKRRNTIRGGFRELTDLVPTLKNTNNPKSTILFKSVEYIKQLEKRNSQLKNTLIMLQQKMKQRQQRKKISYHSISIPSDIVNSNTYSTPALVMPASVDDWLLNQSYSTTASFNIPAVDNDNFIVHGRESLLSSGKLNHLK